MRIASVVLFSALLLATSGCWWETSKLQQAESALRDDQWQKAIDLAGEHLEKHPKSAEALLLRGKAYEKLGNDDAALADYTAAIETNPKFAKAYYQRARFHERRGQLELAKADEEAGHQVDPEYQNLFGSQTPTPVAKTSKKDQASKRDAEEPEPSRVKPFDIRSPADDAQARTAGDDPDTDARYRMQPDPATRAAPKTDRGRYVPYALRQSSAAKKKPEERTLPRQPPLNWPFNPLEDPTQDTLAPAVPPVPRGPGPDEKRRRPSEDDRQQAPQGPTTRPLTTAIDWYRQPGGTGSPGSTASPGSGLPSGTRPGGAYLPGSGQPGSIQPGAVQPGLSRPSPLRPYWQNTPRQTGIQSGRRGQTPGTGNIGGQQPPTTPQPLVPFRQTPRSTGLNSGSR